MQFITDILFPDCALAYVGMGFSEKEARAMSFIAEQKTKGKVYGLFAGSLISIAWVKWSKLLLSKMNINLHTGYSHFFLIGLSVACGDYVFSVRRYGADRIWSNYFRLNNNTLFANLDSINSYFKPLNRRFTDEQLQIFRFRSKAIVNSVVPLSERKWIQIPAIETHEQFLERVKRNTTAPWKSQAIKSQIKKENEFKKTEIQYAPAQLNQIIDETGQKFGIVVKKAFGIRLI